ncbi:MAG: c-type cytochrome [Pseudomonadales bacterium]
MSRSITCLLLLVTLSTGVQAQEMTDRQRQMWSRSCALCHVSGEAFAPRIGHPEEWRARLDKGMDVLLTHTLEGLDRMPPLGYCMGCEEADFAAMITFMAMPQVSP